MDVTLDGLYKLMGVKGLRLGGTKCDKCNMYFSRSSVMPEKDEIRCPFCDGLFGFMSFHHYSLPIDVFITLSLENNVYKVEHEVKFYEYKWFRT